MEMLISEYLSPLNPHAAGLVAFLQFLFFLWFAGLIAYMIWLIITRKHIRNLEDVRPLAAARRERNPDLEEEDESDEAHAAFSKYCNSKSIPQASHVANHFKAIFLAGWTETRLEPGDLINYTISSLMRWNGLIRSVMAIFIVIGLLGTIFGLADSITILAPSLDVVTADTTSQENTKKITNALGNLLGSMKGAMAPSIWGIGFTILGVLLYGCHVHLFCHPVNSGLKRLTFTVWIPRLYPTTSQKLIRTLQESEQQMRRGYDTATRVGELVETVQDNISEFNENLRRANDITQPLSDSASQLNATANTLNSSFVQSLTTFSDRFSENVQHLTSFQGEIRSLYEQIADESMLFQAGANHRLDEQNQKLATTLNALKSYEEAYVASRQELDETLRQFINEAKEANTSLNANNRHLLEDIKHQLNLDLQSLQQVLDNRLSALVDRFNRFETPLANAADKIETIVENFAKLSQGTVENLQQQFEKQNDNNRDQLDAISDLNRKIVSLLVTLDESSSEHGTAVQALSENVVSLTEEVRPLSDSIQSLTSDAGDLSRAIVAIGEQVESISATSRQLVEQTREATQSLSNDTGVLSKSVESIGEEVETLGTISQHLAEKADVATKSLASDAGGFATAIEAIETQVDGLTTSFHELISITDSVTQSLTSDSGSFGKSVAAVENHVKSLGHTASAIEALVEKSGANSESLSDSMGSIHEHIELLGATTQRLIEKADVTALTAEISLLREAIKEIAQHGETLAESARATATQTPDRNPNESSSNRGSSWSIFKKKQD